MRVCVSAHSNSVPVLRVCFAKTPHWRVLRSRYVGMRTSIDVDDARRLPQCEESICRPTTGRRVCVRIAGSGVRAHTISLLHTFTVRVCDSHCDVCVVLCTETMFSHWIRSSNFFFIQAYGVVDKGSRCWCKEQNNRQRKEKLDLISTFLPASVQEGAGISIINFDIPRME